MEDYESAAIRHLKDAELLSHAGEFDNAGHLVGFAAECAIKHSIHTITGGAARPHGHMPNFVVTARKHLNQRSSMFDFLKQDRLVGWDVNQRYYRSGTVSEQHVSLWLSETKRLFACAKIRNRS
ncbi:hypothetical protein [Herbaspirillum robiniae]|uniref:hypothetical protein n=1 Tax=Herbaspirillum robiniae TaxID=2014887 RepID=UPI0011E4D32C|nr:hypothetical protein [Herbaspirillum robiniae]